MDLPPLTPDQRADALEKAAIARKERAAVKNRLKHGTVTLSEVIKAGSTDDVIGKMKVSAVLESLPGVGKVRAKHIMERLGITDSRRVRGLGANQRAALEAEFGAESSGASHSGTVTAARPAARTATELYPVRIYLPVGQEHESVERAVRELLDLCGLEVVQEVPEVRGSWYRKLVAAPKTGNPDGREAMKMLSTAVRFQALGQADPPRDAQMVDSVTKLMTALSKEESAAIQLGAILFVKVNDTYTVLSLTTRQILLLEQDPGLMRNPATVLSRLKRAVDGDTASSA